jgi:hypothetical protein
MIKKEVLDIGYDVPGNGWIHELSQVWGEPVQVISPESVPPSSNEGAVFYVPRLNSPVHDQYSDAHFVYVNIRRRARELQGFRVEVRVEEHGQEYSWMSDQIKYIRLDPARTGVQFFNSFGEEYSPILTITNEGKVVPSLVSLATRSRVR